MLSFPSSSVSAIAVTLGSRVERLAGAGADGISPDSATASNLRMNHASACAGNLQGLKALMTFSLAVMYVTYGARAGLVDMPRRQEGSPPPLAATAPGVERSVAARRQSAVATRERTAYRRAIRVPGR